MPDMSKTNKRRMLTEARKLFDEGFTVVPTKRGEKIPLAKWGNRRPGWDEVENLLADGNANIAVKLTDSPIPIVDVEFDDEEGREAFHEMFGDDPETVAYASGRGEHYWFLKPDGLPDKAVVKLNGVEFHIGNKNALTTVPPSIHKNGTVYKWLPGKSFYEIEQLAEIPPEIVEQLTGTEKKTAKGDKSISEGSRNDALFKLACTLRDTKLSEPAALAAVQAENNATCDPPLPDSEVASIVKSAFNSRPQRPQNSSQILMECATANSEFWHRSDVAHVTMNRDGTMQHYRVRSTEYRQLLNVMFYDATSNAINSQALQDCLNIIEGKARFEGAEYEVFIRVAQHNGKIYVDIGDDTWKAVEIDSKGWRVVENPPVRFRRTKGMKSLAYPVDGGSFKDLRKFVNVTDEDWPLLLAFIVACFRPDGPFPILKLIAEQGSGKTWLEKVLRDLIDPNSAPVRSAPKCERDLFIAALNGWLVALDNLSGVAGDLSDALCRLVSGGSFATRTLYADDDENLMTACRPVVMNGIEEIGLRSDLIDRSIQIELPRIAPKDRKPEKVFWKQFENAKPAIMGAIFTAVSTALKRLPKVERTKNLDLPRMADFAMWSIAAEPAFGIDEGTFLQTYNGNRDSANVTALEGTPIYKAIVSRLNVRTKGLELTAEKLLKELSIGQNTKAKGWPGNARALSGILKRLSPNLRSAGIDIEQRTESIKGKKDKLWCIKISS